MVIGCTVKPEVSWAELVVGISRTVPLLDGSHRQYVNLDNAASTPPLVAVRDAVYNFSEWYSSVHRGSGFKSQLSTATFEHARRRVMEFVGADPESQVAVFAGNTTDAINRIAYRLGLGREDVVVTSIVEHHSNLLPWRDAATVAYAAVDEEGRIDLADLEACLARHAGRVRIVAVTGASNVSGYTPPIHTIARMAHSHGAYILVDVAQLAAHRRIDARPAADPGHLDFVALSAHKMYAPYGSGALVAPRHVLARGRPFLLGGGAVEMVTDDDVVFSEPPEREEAGSPNVIGAVALAMAIETLQGIGMDEVEVHESDLTAYALRRLRRVPGLTIYGPSDPDDVGQRVGVITFNLASAPHALVAAILSCEFGIGVRHGCFCAHPYVLHLLKVDEAEAARAKAAILRHDKSRVPGAVRMSLGLYNTRDDVDLLVEALNRIAAADCHGSYCVDPPTGDYVPIGWSGGPSDPWHFALAEPAKDSVEVYRWTLRLP